MQTPTHALLALALLAKDKNPKRNRIILIGALIPDLFIYICWVWLTTHGISQDKIWTEIYFQSSVQFWSGLSNSVPIYAALAWAGWIMRKKTAGVLLLVFALAALTHMATDFPFHAEDAHQHFWPFTHWKFHSPVSYWDPKHYGQIISSLEILLAFLCIGALLKRLTGPISRIVLYIMMALYSLMIILRIAFWAGIIGG